MPSYQLDDAGAPVRLGRYELIGHLATGGMAEIHLARLAGEAGFEKIVVVKRLLPELVASPAYVAMFLDEGKLVARLAHPNICEVFELGKEGAEYFLAMPYLEGIPAHDLIARPRDPDRATQIRVAAGVIVQACAGLHHAHELRDADGAPANLVHRDVSPSNLFVTTAGIVKVLDFGIAKVRGAAETEVGTIKGKQQYMAPEQVLGEAVDRRCDVFALGIVAFELVTHQRLFKRASDYLAARAILEEDIPRADAIDPAVSAPLADAIAKALSRDKAARFPDAAAFGKAIEAAVAPLGGLASPEEIAASVIQADELTAQRTRKARVLGESQIATSVVAAPTRPIRGRAAEVARTAVDERPRGLAIWFLLALVVIGGAGAIAYTLRDRGHAALDAAVVATAPPPDAAPPAPVITPIVDAAPEPVVEPPPPEVHHPRAPGTFSIESQPFATIFVDGKRIDVTPILKHSIAAGHHKVRAVLADGREKTFTIDVPAGKLATPVRLTW